MQLWKINHAIEGLCEDIEETITSKSWQQMNEEDIVHELLLCILGSGVRYEIAVAYALEITSSKCLKKRYIHKEDVIEKNISFILNNEASNYWGGKSYKRYRYPNAKASYISSSYCNIIREFGSFKHFLNDGLSPAELRRTIVLNCPGIGPKQASHFLKNVGYSNELAILDRHIVKYMEITDNTNISTYQLGRLDKYEDIELQFINTVKKFKYPIAIVDQAMWFVMRALGSEVTT